MQAGNITLRAFPKEMTQEERDAAWNLIQRNLQAALDGHRIDCTSEELCRNVYNMVYLKQGRFVYDGVRELLKQHIDKMATKLENMANSQERNNQVLLQVDQHWRNFIDRMVANAEEIADHMESPLFNVDTIVEIMTFLTTFKLGLQVSTAARQMAKLSDYVLNKRKRILRPIALWNKFKLEPFATQLQKKAANLEWKRMNKIFDGWHTNMAWESRICLPDIEPPEWLAGVELIYIMHGMNDRIYRFLNAFRAKLQNCQLVLNLYVFIEMQKAGRHSLQFLSLFNERSFSLVLNIPALQGSRTKTDQLFAAKWPLWAIFNGIFLPKCRELTLPIVMDEIDGMSKWLMHPSTENQPRLLKLRSATGNWRNAAVTMLRLIKEDFFNPTGRRMFFVEFPNGTAIPAGQQGEWQNGNGEQLRIHPTRITRLPVDQSEKEFKDFYELPEVQPKLVFK